MENVSFLASVGLYAVLSSHTELTSIKTTDRILCLIPLRFTIDSWFFALRQCYDNTVNWYAAQSISYLVITQK